MGHCFSCKHKREGQTICCMSLKGGIIFYAKLLGSRSQSRIELISDKDQSVVVLKA